MRPPVSAAASLQATPDAASGDSDLVWLELDEIDTDWKEARDLPTDVVQIIRSTASHLEELDPYSLIGVEQDAEWTEIERAYRKRLATFHPHRWNGYHLADLRPSMEAVSQRISHAFAFLAEEAAREGTLTTPVETSLDRPTRPVELDAIDLDFSGERPTFPSSGALSIATVADDPAPRAPTATAAAKDGVITDRTLACIESCSRRAAVRSASRNVSCVGAERSENR